MNEEHKSNPNTPHEAVKLHTKGLKALDSGEDQRPIMKVGGFIVGLALVVQNAICIYYVPVQILREMLTVPSSDRTGNLAGLLIVLFCFAWFGVLFYAGVLMLINVFSKPEEEVN